MKESLNGWEPIWDAKDLAMRLGITTRQLNGLINKYDYPQNGRVRKTRSRVSRGTFGYIEPIFDVWWNRLQHTLSQKRADPSGFDEWWKSTGKKRGRRVALCAWLAAVNLAQEQGESDE